jgi:hypothetical protein
MYPACASSLCRTMYRATTGEQLDPATTGPGRLNTPTTLLSNLPGLSLYDCHQSGEIVRGFAMPVLGPCFLSHISVLGGGCIVHEPVCTCAHGYSGGGCELGPPPATLDGADGACPLGIVNGTCCACTQGYGTGCLGYHGTETWEKAGFKGKVCCGKTCDTDPECRICFSLPPL